LFVKTLEQESVAIPSRFNLPTILFDTLSSLAAASLADNAVNLTGGIVVRDIDGARFGCAVIDGISSSILTRYPSDLLVYLSK
jgi:hypothetical protein